MKKKLLIIINIILGVACILLLTNLGSNDAVANQIKQEELMEKEYQEKDYTTSNPYIKVNPYDTNELSAYIAFESEEPVHYSYTVQGKNDASDLHYIQVDDSYNKHVVIPVIGLYDNYENKVDVVLTKKDGSTETFNYTVSTKNNNVSDIIIKANVNIVNQQKFDTYMQQSYNNGRWIIDSRNNIYDMNGDLRLHGVIKDQAYGYINPFNGQILVPSSSDYQELYSVNLMGRIDGDLIYEAPDGYTFRKSAVMADEKLYALGRRTNPPADEYLLSDILVYNKYGNLTEIIDLNDYFDSDELQTLNNSKVNDFQLNSIDYYADQNQLILSSRSLSQIFGYDLDSESIEWIIGNPDTIAPEYEDLLITNTELEPTLLNGQYSVSVVNEQIPDDEYNPEHLYLSVLNNNSCMADNKGQYKLMEEDTDYYSCSPGEASALILEIDLINQEYHEYDKLELPTKSQFNGSYTITNNFYKEVYLTNEQTFYLYDENNELIFSMYIPLNYTIDEKIYRARTVKVQTLLMQIK